MPLGWIKIREDLPDDPAVFAIAHHLNVTENHVLGLLTRFWIWAQRYTETGRIVSGKCPENVRSKSEWMSDIDRIVHEPHFAEALEIAGWLDFGKGCIVIPKFNRHNSKSAKQRALDAERKTQARAKKRPDNVRIPTGQNADQRREEKRREDVKTKTPKPPTNSTWIEATKHMDSKALKTKAFEIAWVEWEQYRRKDLRKGFGPRTIKLQIQMLETLGHDNAIKSIEQSIRNGWSGLFEPNGRGPSKSTDTAAERRAAKAAKEYPEDDVRPKHY